MKVCSENPSQFWSTRANQEIVYGQDQGSTLPPLRVGAGQWEIARTWSISQGAVHSYPKKAAVAEICSPFPEGLDGRRVEQAPFGGQCPNERSSERALPDFAALHQQLQQHRHLTRQLVWEEHRQARPEGYGYSRFCELYQRWCDKQDVVTGEVWLASLFVAVRAAGRSAVDRHVRREPAPR